MSEPITPLTDEQTDAYIAHMRSHWEMMKRGDSLWGMTAEAKLKKMNSMTQDELRKAVWDAESCDAIDVLDCLARNAK